jgi:serpin B
MAYDAVSQTDTIVREVNSAAFRFFQAMNLSENKNFVFSPISFYSAAGAIYCGAKGKTASDIAQSIPFSLKEKPFTDSFKRLSDSLLADRKENTFFIQNTISSPAGCLIKENYREIVQKNFFLQFISDSSLTENNSIAYSLSGIFNVNCAWKKSFDYSCAEKMTFQLSEKETVDSKFLSICNSFKYGETPDFKILEIPAENQVSMILFIPKNAFSDKECTFFLEEKNANLWNVAGKFTKVYLVLPEIHFIQTIDVKSYFETLPASSIYEKTPNFSNISNKICGFSNFKIQSEVNINAEELGSHSLSLANISDRVKPEDAEVKLIVDRPFYFKIIDNKTGLILIAGKIVNPLSEN